MRERSRPHGASGLLCVRGGRASLLRWFPLLLGLLGPFWARGQEASAPPEVILQRLGMASTPLGLYGIEAARTLDAGQGSAGLGLSYAYQPLRISLESGPVTLVGGLSEARVNLAYGLRPGIELATSLPLVRLGQVKEEGSELFLSFFSGLEPMTSPVALGDVRVQGRFRLAEPIPGRVVGLVLAGQLPTGDPQTLAGSGRLALEVWGAAELRQEHTRLLANVGYRFFPGEVPTLGPLGLGDEALVRLGGEFTLVPACLRLFAELVGSTVVRPWTFSWDRTPIEIVLGARFRLWPGIELTGGASAGLTSGYGAPSLRGFLGLHGVLPQASSDFFRRPSPYLPDRCHCRSIRVQVTTSPSANAGQVLWVMLRAVDAQTFALESYEEVASKLEAVDASILSRAAIPPGTTVELKLERPGASRVAVYALFRDHREPWRLLLPPELPSRLELEVVGTELILR